MKRTTLAVYLILWVSCICHAEKPMPKYYLATWDSLKSYQVPEWYQDAKFGIWPIWGLYSVPEFRGDHAAEWYPRWMYLVEDPNKPFSEYNQKGAAIAKHHRETYGDPSRFGYHDFIPMFKAEKWDPDQWAQFGVDCGAKFFTVLSEFCDNFAMYDSSYTRWNAFQMGPRRDVTGELARSVRDKGMKFGVSCHLSLAPSFFENYHRNGFAKGNEQLSDFYSDGVYDDKFRENWWNRVTELASKYDPDLYYFDWCWNTPFWDAERPEFCAFYYNQAIRRGKGTFGRPEVVINYKNAAIAKGCAVYDMERGKMSSPMDFVWQTDTSVSDYSWGYSATDEYKTPKHLVTLLADIVSKNGILLLAFGPKADGTIPEEYRVPMLEVGRWLKVNGEAIYATRPWTVAEEGPTDSNHEMAGDLYGSKDIRYTQSKDGQKLYAIVFGLPHGKLALLSTKVTGKTPDAKVTLLANGNNIPFAVNAKQQLVLDMSGITAENAGCEYAYGLRIEGFDMDGVSLSAMDRSGIYMDDIADYDPRAGEFPCQYPYLSGLAAVYERAHNGVKRDMNYHGKTIRIGGRQYEHGLMVCPAGEEGRGIFVVGISKLPAVKGFSAEIGIEDAATKAGNSAFIMEAYVSGQWQSIYQSSVLTYQDKAVKVDVEIPAGSEFIRLITTDGGNGCNSDHAVWADAQFY